MIALGLAGLLLATGCARTPEQINQRQARRLAAQTMQAMGGQRALRDIRFLQFDYIDERPGSEPIRRNSLFNSPAARSGRFDPKELEHTNSAR